MTVVCIEILVEKEVRINNDIPETKQRHKKLSGSRGWSIEHVLIMISKRSKHREDGAVSLCIIG
jgi:hypothetical protein